MRRLPLSLVAALAAATARAGANAIVRFDPVSERFATFPSDRRSANVRQMLGRKGEVWGAESGTDRLVRVRHGDGPRGVSP